MPVRASCEPRTGISNVFRILRDPYGARAGRHLYGHVRESTQPEFAKITHGASFVAARGRTDPLQSRRRWFETPSRSLWRHCNVHGGRQCDDVGKFCDVHFSIGHIWRQNNGLVNGLLPDGRYLNQYWHEMVMMIGIYPSAKNAHDMERGHVSVCVCVLSHGLFTGCLRKLIMHALKYYGPRTGRQNSYDAARGPYEPREWTCDFCSKHPGKSPNGARECDVTGALALDETIVIWRVCNDQELPTISLQSYCYRCNAIDTFIKQTNIFDSSNKSVERFPVSPANLIPSVLENLCHNTNKLSLCLWREVSSSLEPSAAYSFLGPLLLTWFNFNPSMDK